MLSAGDTTVTLESAGNLTEKASSKIAMETANLEGKGSAQVKLEGGMVDVKSNGTMNLQATGTTAVKGLMVNIN